MTELAQLVRTGRIIITAGSGGVGKTTIAAVLAMEAARAGRRAVVVTIDPAKRLADALGLSDGLSNEPRRIDGDWDGELWAMMLDTKSTFDAVVAKHAETPEQAARIHENRFYRNISGALSGTQEYMAAEKLYELHEESKFDLVVVDTPPTRNALDFLNAPDRLSRFLDHRLYRLLMAPTRGFVRAVNVATQAFLRTVSRVVGSDVLDDAVAFFRAFDGMEEGFRERAARVGQLLVDPATAFVLVASPRRDAVAEATYFADRLAETDIGVHALVVNRMYPRFSRRRSTQVAERAADLAETPLAPFARALADFDIAADREHHHLSDLTRAVHPAPVVQVPILESDVHDVEGLEELAAHML
ncbi:MAG: ArsA family ATPase [Acidimicrobiales bacterium]